MVRCCGCCPCRCLRLRGVYHVSPQSSSPNKGVCVDATSPSSTTKIKPPTSTTRTGGRWTNRITGLLSSIYPHLPQESTQPSDLCRKEEAQGPLENTCVKDFKVSSGVLPVSATISFAKIKPSQDSLYEGTYSPHRCSHTNESTCNEEPHCSLESDDYKFCRKCIKSGIFPKSRVFCNHVHCIPVSYQESFAYEFTLSSSCSSACIETHVCKHHQCHRCVESDGAVKVVHSQRRSSYPGAFFKTSPLLCSSQHKITLAEKGFPLCDNQAVEEEEANINQSSISQEAVSVITGAQNIHSVQKDTKEIVSNEDVKSVFESPSPHASELVGHSIIRTKLSERNIKFYQSFSRKWNKFMYKLSITSDDSKDHTKEEETSGAENPEDLPDTFISDKPHAVRERSTTSSSSSSDRYFDLRSKRDSNREVLSIKDIEVGDYQEGKGSLPSVTDTVTHQSLTSSHGSSIIRRIKKDLETPRSTSESLLFQKSQEKTAREIGSSSRRGSCKVKDSQVNVLSCPSLNRIRSSVDRASEESLGPTLSNYSSNSHVGTYSGGISSLSDDEKKDSGEGSVSSNSNINDETLEDQISDDEKTLNDDFIPEDKSGNLDEKERESKKSSLVSYFSGKSNDSVDVPHDLKVDCSSAINRNYDTRGEESLERRSSVASTASEGKGTQRVNRIVSSTLGQLKRFQGSLGNLTTNIKRRLSKENKSIETISSFDTKEEPYCTEEDSEVSQVFEDQLATEQDSASSLRNTSLGRQQNETDSFWERKLVQHDLKVRNNAQILQSYHLSLSKGTDSDDILTAEIHDRRVNPNSLPYDAVSPMSVSECTAELSVASNSSGTTSSEGGDASIQSFLSVIAKVKKEKRIGEPVKEGQIENMEHTRSQQEGVDICELFTGELAQQNLEEEGKMDYQEPESSVSLRSEKIKDESKCKTPTKEATDDESKDKIYDHKPSVSPEAGVTARRRSGDSLKSPSKSKGKRRGSRKMSRGSRESQDLEGEPLPKRPSLDALSGIVNDPKSTDASQNKAHSNVQSEIVSTRRLFCEGMMGDNSVGSSEIDSQLGNVDKLCDKNIVKDEDNAITSALEKKTHTLVLDETRTVDYDLGYSIDTSSNLENRHHGDDRENMVNVDMPEHGTGNILPSSNTSSIDEIAKINDNDVRMDISHDREPSENRNESAKTNVACLSAGNLESVLINEKADVLVEKENQDVSSESAFVMKSDKELIEDQDLDNEDSREHCIPSDSQNKDNLVQPKEVLDSEDNTDPEFSNVSKPLTIIIGKQNKQSCSDGAFNVEEASIGGPKIVVTGAVMGADSTHPEAPVIMLETESLHSGGDDGSLEGEHQHQDGTYVQSSSNLTTHLGAHPHRPPTPKSPITVDEWVAALPHPTSVDEDGEAWSGCEHSGEDLDEDFLNLGDEAGLMTGSRGPASAASFAGGTSSTCTRDSMLGTRIIDAQNSETGTNITGTEEASLSIASPQRYAKLPSSSPSHCQRPITLTDVECILPKQLSPSPSGVESRRHQFASLRDKQTSFQSDLSGLSLHSKSSIDSLLDSRQADPVDVLLSLGFGSQSQDGISRIPERFLRPSQVPGNNIDEFIKSEDEFSDMMESAEWMPGGIDPQGLVVAGSALSPRGRRYRRHRLRPSSPQPSIRSAPATSFHYPKSRFLSVHREGRITPHQLRRFQHF